MRRLATLIATLALAWLAACAPRVESASVAPSNITEQRTPVTILISIDGFRADYLGRGETPTLARLAANGVSAAMIPSYPTKTFPNHWTLVTGYYPDHHGIVANNFYDPARPNDKFTMSALDPFFWNSKEPIWVTAEKAGIRSATMLWPGSGVAIGGQLASNGYGRTEGGTRPSDWAAWDPNIAPDQRVRGVLDWLRRPAGERPRLILLYFDDVDTAGHASGPDGPEIAPALRAIDARIAALVDGMAALSQPANLVIVADHGMAEVRGSRTIALDAIIPHGSYTLIESGPFAQVSLSPATEAATAAKLIGKHPHLECWTRATLPARLHYGTNPRIAPYFCIPETGWQVFEARPADDKVGGNHGFDNAAPEMRALFIASGPAFRAGTTLPPFENVDVNPLLRRLIGVPQDPSLDGTLGRLEAALAE